MATPKLTGFLIGIILISLGASVFAIYMTSLSDGYQDTTSSYNSSSLSKYSDKMETIRNQTKQLEESTKVDAQTSWVDILGGYFASAYKSVRVSFASYGLFTQMVNDGLNDAGSGTLGSGLQPFKEAIGLIIAVLVFLGIFVAIMVKWHTI